MVEDVLVLVEMVLIWKLQVVLILVVVEDVLVHVNSVGNNVSANYVLILVVVEDVLVLLKKGARVICFARLNPCCGGRCSSTELYKTKLIINKLKNFTKQIFTFLNRKLTIS